MATLDDPRTNEVPGPPNRRRIRVTPRQYRVITVVALAMIAAIVVTGAAVRLTGSGLGCETWPNCSEGQLLEFGTPNQTIEQVNRLFTGFVSLSVIAAVLGSLWRVPRRADLIRWSLALVAGVLGQIVLGGITVLVDLHPAAVAGHFVLSMILLACAVTLLCRARQEPGPRQPRVSGTELALSRVVLMAAAALMVTGPLVTGSGPHAGDARAQRFDFMIPDVVRIHSINMWIFLIALVVLMAAVARSRAGADILGRAQWLLGATVLQGTIGYAQYSMGIPEWLVLVHIAGATTVLGLTVWFHLGLSAPASATNEAHGPTFDPGPTVPAGSGR
jgi:heme a synthase